ncbi:MAG: adenylate/guanylate cyclase domain-containing protein [Candidatus Rifleibacteriota bacterium]
MKEVENQNFGIRLSIDRDDELGELCHSFDEMAKGLAEKELMGKMLSKSAVRSISNEDSERKNVPTHQSYAFVFVGIPGFTSWLGSGSVADLFSDLQKQTAEICRIIFEEGGDIDKFIGDKQLGIFSADNPRSAVKSAFKAINRILMAETGGKLPFPVAIGANFGEVISGYLGVGEKRDFTVIGDAVNIAARIEKEAEKIRFKRGLFSESFIEKLDNQSEFRLYADVQLKGKNVSLKLFSQI